MITRASQFIAALLALTLVGCSKHPPMTTTPQTITFAGFTNGYVGPVAPVFARLSPKNAAAVQQWLVNGTNNALFTITNLQSCDILIAPFARILNAGANPTNDETPILNAPGLPASSASTFSDIRLKPGQVANLQTAVFLHQPPWRMRFFYIRTDRRIRFTDQFNHLIFRKPLPLQRLYFIDSDLISQ